MFENLGEGIYSECEVESLSSFKLTISVFASMAEGHAHNGGTWLNVAGQCDPGGQSVHPSSR